MKRWKRLRIDTMHFAYDVNNWMIRSKSKWSCQFSRSNGFDTDITCDKHALYTFRPIYLFVWFFNFNICFWVGTNLWALSILKWTKNPCFACFLCLNFSSNRYNFFKKMCVFVRFLAIGILLAPSPLQFATPKSVGIYSRSVRAACKSNDWWCHPILVRMLLCHLINNNRDSSMQI